MQLSIARGRDVRENLDFSGSLAPGVRQHIEVAQQNLSVGRYGHRTAPFAPAARTLWAEEVLREMEAQFVRSHFQRNVVREISLAAVAIDNRVLRPPDVLHGTCHRATPGEISIRTP